MLLHVCWMCEEATICQHFYHISVKICVNSLFIWLTMHQISLSLWLMCFGPYCTVYILCISSQRADGRQAWLRAEEENRRWIEMSKTGLKGFMGRKRREVVVFRAMRWDRVFTP